jgi:hypothetical protein
LELEEKAIVWNLLLSLDLDLRMYVFVVVVREVCEENGTLLRKGTMVFHSSLPSNAVFVFIWFCLELKFSPLPPFDDRCSHILDAISKILLDLNICRRERLRLIPFRFSKLNYLLCCREMSTDAVL